MLNKIKCEMKKFYEYMRCPEDNPEFIELRDKMMMDIENYTASPILVKSRMHTVVAEHFKPVIFKNSPFFYEMGVRQSQNWGTPIYNTSPAGVMYNERRKILDNDEIRNSLYSFKMHDEYNVYNCVEGFDIDHHTLDYKTIFEKGLNGIISDIDEKLKTDRSDFYIAAKESCMALIKTAEKFAVAADKKIPECESEKQIKYMKMISRTARRIPGNPPETFYEGLAMIWFLRECVASLEGIGISVLGRVDELLGNLYENDKKSGVITESEVRELLALWMVPTDIKFFLDESEWPETSTCIELGGCDADGNDVYNDVTRLIIEVHEENKFVNPKLNCRYSKQSSDEYLRIIARSMLNKHNNFAFINDDSMISSLIKGGITERDARCYVNGGCQEAMTDGMGHSAGADYYLNLPRILDLSMRKLDVNEKKVTDRAKNIVPRIISDAKTFDEFYDRFIENTDLLISTTLGWLAETGKKHPGIHPCPLFSSMQKGCIESGRDYTAGGAKYNHATTCLCGIGTLADSLYAIKKLVYDNKELSFEEINKILESDWNNNEPLRLKCVNMPKYGHGDHDVDSLAKKFLTDINRIISSVHNERGGKFIVSMFVYSAYKEHGKNVRATPDGRHNGDMLNQGIAPGRVKKAESITNVFETVRNMHYNDIAGNSVLDVVMPFSTALTEDIIVSFIRAAGASGCPTVQLNILSADELKDAQINPDKHKDLMVRVCGLSVYFVTLSKEYQDEVISRNFFSAS